MARPRTKQPKAVETIKHVDDTRTNIPTAEYEPVLSDEDRASIRIAYERRNRDLDPQLVWRGKDEQDWSDLVVYAPPLYIQEKVHPKVLIDDLVRHSKKEPGQQGEQIDLFADFNGMPEGADKTEFYEHEQGWTNRMILGDSLQVMASLAEREGLQGNVQCIYIDPPYGIKFNSNFQWSTATRDVKDGNLGHITREPEQVKAFRDTWRDGVHSYLTYLRDRLTVARDLLAESGSIFVQIGDENLHRVRLLVDEVFGAKNFVAQIAFHTTSSRSSDLLDNVVDFVLYYAKDINRVKHRTLFIEKLPEALDDYEYRETEGGVVRLKPSEMAQYRDDSLGTRYFLDNPTSQGETATGSYPLQAGGRPYYPTPGRHWSATREGMERLITAGRMQAKGERLFFKKYASDSWITGAVNVWTDTRISGYARQQEKIYVVQTATRVIERCILLATDPGDLVLDPTCGSGTTAFVAEKWGRRWITADTSRVALALARARVMGARYPYYLLADSSEGQLKQAELTGTAPSAKPAHGSVRHGFVYGRAPHITLGAVADNVEIDVISDRWQETIDRLRQSLNAELAESWEEWEVPPLLEESWSDRARQLHRDWSAARVARQDEIDASIAAKAEFEKLYDKPYEDKTKVRVAGPFTVESLSPHRMLGVGENDELIDPLASNALDADAEQTFTETILENLKAAGVQQAHKGDRITFTSLMAWPGQFVCGEGRYLEGETEKRAAIFIGPEFGTVLRTDLVEAAREAADGGFDVLIACAFNYEAHATEFNKLGAIPVLKARMNADLHMADDLKATGKGNLFVIFGEPEIELLDAEDGKVQVKILGVDVFDPSTGQVRSDTAAGIACWFIDTEYNEESFFVRHAYFLGADDPYKALKTTLKAEIDEDAWGTLHSDTSRPFDRPATGRIAVKVINHLGDEVMKVFRV